MGHGNIRRFGEMLVRARERVEVGGRYRHAKSGREYNVIDLVIIESSEEVGVVYEAQYGERLRWMRTVENFCEEVEVNGGRRKRFELMRGEIAEIFKEER